MKRIFAMFLAAISAAAIALPASAVTIDFKGPDQVLGQSQAYEPITASGFAVNGGKLKGQNLYQKNFGANETGLGLSKNNDHEISSNDVVVLDLTNLVGQQLQLGFESVQVQSGEKWKVSFSNTFDPKGDVNQFIGAVSGSSTLFNFGIITNRFVLLEAEPGDVLLRSLTATPVPEPASIALLAAGLLGVGFMRRKA